MSVPVESEQRTIRFESAHCEDWVEIRRLYRSARLSQDANARGCPCRETVGKVLEADAPPRCEWALVNISAWAQI